MRNTLLIVLLSLFIAPVQSFAGGKKLKKIVIDAGHGGRDAGARGSFSSEKDLTLAIALRVGKMIQDSLKDVEVIYTRTTDIYPTLPERHEIANRAGADLFISVHINATAPRIERILTGHKTVKRGKKKVKVPVYRNIYHRETSASGTESWVLGLHRNSQKADAIGENMESVTEETLDENDPQTQIIIANYSQAYLSSSVMLGNKVQAEFGYQGRNFGGVKQKGLEVLAGSAMPGVLIECGFINNPDEEVYMNSEDGQKQIATAIYRGVRSYKVEIER